MFVLPILILVFFLPFVSVALVVRAATQPTPQRVVRRRCEE